MDGWMDVGTNARFSGPWACDTSKASGEVLRRLHPSLLSGLRCFVGWGGYKSDERVKRDAPFADEGMLL